MIDLHSITLNQCRIQGIFGASKPVWVPKKSSSTPPRSFFFYQTDKLISFVLRLLKAVHLTCLLLSQTPMRYSYFLSNIWQVTIQKNLNIVYACFRTIDFSSKLLFGGGGGRGDGLLSIFCCCCYLSHQEKNKLVENKIPRSFLLT